VAAEEAERGVSRGNEGLGGVAVRADDMWWPNDWRWLWRDGLMGGRDEKGAQPSKLVLPMGGGVVVVVPTSSPQPPAARIRGPIAGFGFNVIINLVSLSRPFWENYVESPSFRANIDANPHFKSILNQTKRNLGARFSGQLATKRTIGGHSVHAC
jgi:hypothetical protein